MALNVIKLNICTHLISKIKLNLFKNRINNKLVNLIHTETHHNHEASSDDSESSDNDSDRQSSDNELPDDELPRQLYAEHIPTTLMQKVMLTFGSAAVSIIDPYRHDMIAVFGETSGFWALQNMRRQMLNDSEGREILKDEPRINSTTIDIDKLGLLPEGTFGKVYYDFLTVNKVSPDTRRAVKFVDDVQLAYVMQRYRETHDLVHALLGMPTNMLGEVIVKWIEAIQTDLPMCWSGALFGAIRLAPKQRHNYVNHYLQWALKCGHESKFLMNIYYEKRFDQNILELRKELKIPQLPVIK